MSGRSCFYSRMFFADKGNKKSCQHSEIVRAMGKDLERGET